MLDKDEGHFGGYVWFSKADIAFGHAVVGAEPLRHLSGRCPFASFDTRKVTGCELK